ncbi:MAG: hypothetical protein ACTSUK_03990 [Promethearchaeota archaeon]
MLYKKRIKKILNLWLDEKCPYCGKYVKHFESADICINPKCNASCISSDDYLFKILMIMEENEKWKK